MHCPQKNPVIQQKCDEIQNSPVAIKRQEERPCPDEDQISEEFRQMLYEEVKKVHLTRYPYDKLLYEDAWTQAEDAEAAGWETGVKGEEGRDEG